MEIMGKPDKDINESMKHICDVVQKRIDEAYQRGLNDGESKCRYCNEYQRGLDDAWEAAKKILQMYDFTVFGLEHDGVFENPLNEGQQMTPQEAIEKLKAYEDKQKADDEIKVGDEVNWGGDCFIVTRIFQPRNMKEQCDGIDNDGCVYYDVLMDELEKTGRHSDIMKMLKEMQT